MKTTVVGAILIAATVVAGIFLLLVLNENQNGIEKKQHDGSPIKDRSLPRPDQARES
jgi:hypothetical protein